MGRQQRSFFSWVLWALLGFSGRINRLPYVKGLACLLAVYCLYSFAAGFLYAYIKPPETGEITPQYIVSIVRSADFFPYLIVIQIMGLCLDIKRLRSIGLAIWIAPVFFCAAIAVQYYNSFFEVFRLANFCYVAILIMIPAHSFGNKRAMVQRQTWERLCTGTGEPRRLAVGDITGWTIIPKTSGTDSSEEDIKIDNSRA